MHYPAWVENSGRKHDLLLRPFARGQVRLPFYGRSCCLRVALRYGMFQTITALYVNPGIGWFLCRTFQLPPEITVFEI